MLEVRCALEELAVQLACDRMDEEGVRELRAAAETFESILNSDDITQIAQAQLLNEHQTIIDAIAGHDKELATKFTSQHIKNQAETVVGTIREKEENA